jgi:hypothetical protein
MDKSGHEQDRAYHEQSTCCFPVHGVSFFMIDFSFFQHMVERKNQPEQPSGLRSGAATG